MLSLLARMLPALSVFQNTVPHPFDLGDHELQENARSRSTMLPLQPRTGATSQR